MPLTHSAGMPEPGGGAGTGPPIFGRSVNPILSRRGRFCPTFTTGTPKFFHLPASLLCSHSQRPRVDSSKSSKPKSNNHESAYSMKGLINRLNLYNNLSICVSPCVCSHAISSHIYDQIWTLKVPMDSLGQGGGFKTIYKVIGPEI